MPCKVIGGNTIVCGRVQPGRRCKCGTPTRLLCDFPLGGAKEGQTCDKPVCSNCSVHEEPNKDYCLAHARLFGKA